MPDALLPLAEGAAAYPRRWRTAKGSTVTEPRWGVWKMELDWFEEDCCCPGCSLGFDGGDGTEGMITWHCDRCDAGGTVIAAREAGG